MSKQREIECIDRLITIGFMVDEMVDFFLEEKILETANIPAFKLEKNKALALYQIVESAKNSEKILLFDYEWSILPIERIKLTVVTNRSSKEFAYNAHR